ncbi:MAG: hypothetical protein KTR32_00140 [Granulosicoccus sp.]|nr:hypothetical protein [Granulosicoccus sp.]
MDWLSFFKEFYFQEIDRKYALTRSMAIPVGISTVLASALFVLAGQLTVIATMIDLALFVLLACVALLMLLSFYCLKRFYFNHAYHYLPTTLQIADHRQELEEFYLQSQDEHTASSQADKDSVEYLTQLFARTAHHNALINDERVRWLFWANASLYGALLLLILSALVLLGSSIQFALR